MNSVIFSISVVIFPDKSGENVVFTSKINVTLAVVFCIFMLSGCALQQTSIVVAPPYEGTQKTVKQVAIRVRLLRDFECLTFFGQRLVSKGLQPLQMYIQNNSDVTYVLSGKDISLPLIGKRNVGKYLYHKSTARILLWTFGTVVIYWPFFLPLLLVDTFYGLHSNRMIQNDIDTICINPKQEILIPPQTKIHKIIFFDPEEYTHHLVITLRNHDTDERITFAF